MILAAVNTKQETEQKEMMERRDRELKKKQTAERKMDGREQGGLKSEGCSCAPGSNGAEKI